MHLGTHFTHTYSIKFRIIMRAGVTKSHPCFCTKMASIDDITAALQNLTLTDVTPLDQELGCGAYGKVFTVKYCEKIYTAKEMHSLLLKVANPEEKQKMKNNFLQECYHCSLLRHPNIVRFIGVYYPHLKGIHFSQC